MAAASHILSTNLVASTAMSLSFFWLSGIRPFSPAVCLVDHPICFRFASRLRWGALRLGAGEEGIFGIVGARLLGLAVLQRQSTHNRSCALSHL